MKDMEKIFVKRDGYTPEEAKEEFNEIKEEILDIIGDIDNPFEAYEDVVDLLADYELEPDYLDDLLF